MKFISPAQCRAARALLDWSQPELAKLCDMHVQTISNFEQDNGSPTITTLTKIQEVIENAGVELLDNNGVREIKNQLRILKGEQGFREFYNDIYATLKKRSRTEITLYNGVSHMVRNALGAEFFTMHVERMVEIKHSFRFRVIVEEGDEADIGARYCLYKRCPSDRFKNKTIYTYGTKVALVDFNDPLSVMLFDQPEFAETLLQSFDLAWDHMAISP